MRTASLSFMDDRLAEQAAQGRKRALNPIRRGSEPHVELEGRKLVNLSSNNYLGLASHPDVVAAARAALADGVGSGASRLVAGTLPIHQAFEAAFARFKGAEAGLLFNSGYMANTGVIPCLVGPGDLVLGDELNHASIIDGCRLSRAEVHVYAHGAPDDLRAKLRASARAGDQRRLVVTDSVFSMDGDVAPLAEIAEICEEFGAMLMVDEAHATGCVGPGGRGQVVALNLEDRVQVTMSTLSKALGGLGAVVTGPAVLRDYLLNFARSFIFTTSLPGHVVAAAQAALTLILQEPERLARLQTNAEALRTGLQQMGYNTLGSSTQIVPVLAGESERALAFARELRAEGVFAVAVRPPSVPPGAARVRASVMATHTTDDIALALRAFQRAGERLGLI